MKGYEIVYSEDEDDISIYSACSEEEDSESEESDTDSEEEETREIYFLEVENWEENPAKEEIKIISSYRVNPGTFICDYCQCLETDGLPMFCERNSEILTTRNAS